MNCLRAKAPQKDADLWVQKHPEPALSAITTDIHEPFTF